MCSFGDSEGRLVMPSRMSALGTWPVRDALIAHRASRPLIDSPSPPQHRAAIAIMVCLEGPADVLSIALHTPALAKKDAPPSLAAHDAASTLDAVRGLFAAPDAPEEACHRSRKRRKLDNGHDAALHPTELDEYKSILLAKVSLDLVGGGAALQPSPR
jgi:hypothetical protein